MKQYLFPPWMDVNNLRWHAVPEMGVEIAALQDRRKDEGPLTLAHAIRFVQESGLQPLLAGELRHFVLNHFGILNEMREEGAYGCIMSGTLLLYSRKRRSNKIPVLELSTTELHTTLPEQLHGHIVTIDWPDYRVLGRELEIEYARAHAHPYRPNTSVTPFETPMRTLRVDDPSFQEGLSMLEKTQFGSVGSFHGPFSGGRYNSMTLDSGQFLVQRPLN